MSRGPDRSKGPSKGPKGFKGKRSAKGASVAGAQSRAAKRGAMTKSQTQNPQGTKYGGKLGEFMAKRNAPKTASTLDKTITRNPERFSPEDVAAAAGRLTNTDEFQDKFGSKNKAAESFAGLINQQQQRLEDRFPGGARQLLRGKVSPAGENFALRTFNEAAGFNPTKGMGILDSLRSNYEQSGAKFNRNQAIRGIIGSLIGGPLGGIVLGNMPMPGEERPEGINEFGMPIFDGRQIDEFRTEPTFSPETVIDTPMTPTRRPAQPRESIAISGGFNPNTGLPTDFQTFDIADPGVSNVVIGPDGERYFGKLNQDTGQMEYTAGADPVPMGPVTPTNEFIGSNTVPGANPFSGFNIPGLSFSLPGDENFNPDFAPLSEQFQGVRSLFSAPQDFTIGQNFK
jgi:hypothetical protein